MTIGGSTMTAPDRLNDGTDRTPYLRKDMNLGTMMNLGPDSKAPAYEFTDPMPALSFLKDNGYEAVQCYEPNSPKAAGLKFTGMGSTHDPDALDQIAADQKAAGYECTTLHCGTGFESDDEMARFADALLTAAQKHKHPLYIETHRATMTQDIKRTLDLVEKFPELRFNADLSHWYTGHELNNANFERGFAMMEPVLERVRFIHGRIGNSGSLQVDFRMDDPFEFIDHFRRMWTRCFEGFLREAKPGDYLPFNPEILPHSFTFLNPPLPVNYARLVRQEDGSFAEEGDRWQQAELYQQFADDCFAAAQQNLASA